MIILNEIYIYLLVMQILLYLLNSLIKRYMYTLFIYIYNNLMNVLE